MVAVAAGKFKAECLKLLDRVALRREEIVVTKRGVPVAKIVPIEGAPKPGFGYMQSTLTINDDIVAASAEWQAADPKKSRHDDQ